MKTSHGFISIGIVLIIVIGLAVLGGGGWYILEQTTAIKTSDTASTTPDAQPLAQTTQSSIFDAKKLRAEDAVGAFIAKDVRPYVPSAPQGPDNIYARFSGSVTLRGEFAYGRDLDLGTGLLITDLTHDSRAKLPRQARDEDGSLSFSISNPDAVAAGLQTGDKVAIVTTQYEYVGYPVGGLNKAAVQSVQKVQSTTPPQAVPGQGGFSGPDSDWKIYTDEYGVSFKYPSNWIIHDENESGTTRFVSFTKTGAISTTRPFAGFYVIPLMLGKAGSPRSATPQEYFDSHFTPDPYAPLDNQPTMKALQLGGALVVHHKVQGDNRYLAYTDDREIGFVLYPGDSINPTQYVPGDELVVEHIIATYSLTQPSKSFVKVHFPR